MHVDINVVAMLAIISDIVNVNIITYTLVTIKDTVAKCLMTRGQGLCLICMMYDTLTSTCTCHEPQTATSPLIHIIFAVGCFYIIQKVKIS